MKLEFDLNNNVEKPEIILGKRNYDKYGSILNFDDLTYDYNLMSADSVSFTVHRELNGNRERLWDEIKERRLVWLKEFDEWFEIDVVTNDENGVTKEVVGTSLCEAELGQINIKSAEINTENDIAREDYHNPTVFYKPSKPKESLLHRLLKEVPNYSVKYVDESLYGIQRTFSIDGQTVYDTLTGEIAEEIGCLFLFDSRDRSISVHDLKTNCNRCGYRGDYSDFCPECGGTDLRYGYGRDTEILVDSETLAENISLSGRQDEVKNYIRVLGGDEEINAAIAACNPTGTQYICAFSEADIADMSDGLSQKLDEYFEEYERLTPDYRSIMSDIYEATDERLDLISAMMPDIHTVETDAAKELAKLTASALSPVAVPDLSTASVYTVNNAVLGMAKCIANSSLYKIEIVEGSASYSDKTWRGKFKLTNIADENDHARNTEYITVTVNDDGALYIEQKIKKTIDRSDTQLADIFDTYTDLDGFKAELKKYCLQRLVSFKDAYDAVLGVLINADCANSAANDGIFKSLYVPCYEKSTAITSEIRLRESEIKAVDARLSRLVKQKTEITKRLELENYLGDSLWKELCSFRREDSFENSNYISDGLSESEILAKGRELFEKAKSEAVTASNLQMSLSASMRNLLAIPEFKRLTGMFEGGNWIRVRTDGNTYRLRLIHYKIDFADIQNIEVEFSDVTRTANGLNDVQSLMNAVSSVSSGFNFIAHQAEQGSKSFTELKKIRNDGLSAALYNISASSNQEFVIDGHGITGRKWDDLIGDYLPEQVKFSNNCLVYTDDYWRTAKAALGKITYYDPILGEKNDKYGLLADAVISGILMGDDIIGGNIYSENYSPSAGTHINLNAGTFSFAGGNLTYDGEKLRLNGSVSTADITATGGTIGGFVIGTSAIYNGTDSLVSDKEGVYLGTDGIRSYSSPSAYVNIKNGTLSAVGADISGSVSTADITDTGGTIGGWRITSSKIYGGDGATGVAAIQYPNESMKWVFAAGGSSHDSYLDCPFRVSKSGELYAQKAYIIGSVTAESGSVGGFDIGGTAIYSRTSSLTSNTPGVYLGTDGIRLYSSSSAYVNIANGVLTAKGANITGTVNTSNITATGGTIGGIAIGDGGLYYSGSSASDGFGFWKNGEHPSNGSSVIMHAGGNNTNIGGAAFRVYQNGALYCNNVNITGGSFKVGGSFSVDTSGKLIADGVDITGEIKATKISADSGTVGKWHISDDGYLYGTTANAREAIYLYPEGVTYPQGEFFIVIHQDGRPAAGLTIDGWKKIQV